MVFRRRDRPSFLVRLREFVAPRRGYRRGVEYLGHRVRRLPDTPHRIALGFACGVFASFSPFFGFHILLAAGMALLLRCNVVAALIGTAAGNPLTFPVIAPLSLGIGRAILGHGRGGESYVGLSDAFVEGFVGVRNSLLSLFGIGQSDWGRVLPFFREVFLPYLVGGIVPGIAGGAIVYLLVRPLVAAYQSRRRARMRAMARQPLAEQATASYKPEAGISEEPGP